jgi:outer membrane protein OmpA-like peptidoglycan-associated protein
MNVIRPTLNSVTPQAWGALAGALHESPEHTKQGLADALPMFFAGLIGRSATPTGASRLLSDMNNFGAYRDVDRMAANGAMNADLLRQGGALAHAVLGDRYDSAASRIARHAGVNFRSARTLLGLAAPLALRELAHAAPEDGFTAEGLMRFLQGQRGDVATATPQGLSLGMLEAPDALRRNRWAWFVPGSVVVLLALGLAQCMTLQARDRASMAQSALATEKAPAPDFPTIRLPSGSVLHPPADSISYELATYLAGAQPAPRTFVFDDLSFDSDAVRVTSETTATFDEIAAMLSAYPDVAVRLDGHADDATLSLARADAVKIALMARGVDAHRVMTAGSNAVDAANGKTRGLELTVTAR